MPDRPQSRVLPLLYPLHIDLGDEVSPFVTLQFQVNFLQEIPVSNLYCLITRAGLRLILVHPKQGNFYYFLKDSFGPIVPMESIFHRDGSDLLIKLKKEQFGSGRYLLWEDLQSFTVARFHAGPATRLAVDEGQGPAPKAAHIYERNELPVITGSIEETDSDLNFKDVVVDKEIMSSNFKDVATPTIKYPYDSCFAANKAKSLSGSGARKKRRKLLRAHGCKERLDRENSPSPMLSPRDDAMKNVAL